VPRIVIIAGESSGDLLAGGLIAELRKRYPDARFEGITGPKMRAAGCDSWGDIEQLAVMGLFEILRHLPRILRLKRQIQAKLRENPPDLLIGVDAPEFNLRIERYARSLGIRTVQYVCPSVWAWRSGRVKGIRAACDKVLCLLPFEPEFLHKNNVDACFVGHPLADQIDAGGLSRAAAREVTGIGSGPVVALLPGSRRGEIDQLAPVFLEAASWISRRQPEVRFVVAAASEAIAQTLIPLCEEAAVSGRIKVLTGQTREAVTAADVVLVTSGTATLETLLLHRPMVVAYRASPITAWLLRKSGLVRIDRFSLPNLLAGGDLVQEFIQEQVTAPELGKAIERLLLDQDAREGMLGRFQSLAATLRCNADERAASAVADLLELNNSSNQRAG
jgi:lipid-A-disaccharide synthase